MPGLCRAFQAVDEARGEMTLTYFEFGTLAALRLFSTAGLDVGLLEVGMGGRLDAVNIIAADVALVTAVGIDHSAWLGDDREAIGREKAGILRAGRPAVCADPSPPASLQRFAAEVGAPWYGLGTHFTRRQSGQRWHWQGWHGAHDDLPLPALVGERQLDNAAGVLAVVALLNDSLPVSRAALEQGLRAVRLAGRFQVFPGPPECILDVAHNPDSAGMLASQLQARPAAGHTWLVLGMLADKDAGAYAAALDACVDYWCLASLDVERGLPAGLLKQRIAESGKHREILLFESVADALEHAVDRAGPTDRIVVSGSFVTVAQALACQV